MMRIAAVTLTILLSVVTAASAANSDCDRAILADVARAEEAMRAEVEKNNQELFRMTEAKYSNEAPEDLLARRIYAGLLMKRVYKKPILEAQYPLAVYRREAKKDKDSKVCGNIWLTS